MVNIYHLKQEDIYKYAALLYHWVALQTEVDVKSQTMTVGTVISYKLKVLSFDSHTGSMRNVKSV